jgi:hypothetical protein
MIFTCKSKRSIRVTGAIVALSCLPVCLSQSAPPNNPAPPAQSAAIPVPRAGDPFFAPIASSTPQTLEQKFMDYALITFAPRSLIAPALGSAINMLDPPKNYPRDWKDGAGAFGRNYGSHLATRTSEQTARFLTAAAFHEDFRYHPSTSKNPLVRSAHALAFTFVDKSDSGHNQIAFANFAAAAVGGFTPNLYLPNGYNTTSRAETRMAIAFGGFAAQNLTREFSPELFQLSRKLHVPFPRLPIPEWWTRR